MSFGSLPLDVYIIVVQLPFYIFFSASYPLLACAIFVAFGNLTFPAFVHNNCIEAHGYSTTNYSFVNAIFVFAMLQTSFNLLLTHKTKPFRSILFCLTLWFYLFHFDDYAPFIAILECVGKSCYILSIIILQFPALYHCIEDKFLCKTYIV